MAAPDARSLRRTMIDALPPWRTALAGSLAWAGLMGAASVLKLLQSGWVSPDRMREVGLLFAAGGLIAFPVGLCLARLLSRGRADAAFAAALLAFAVSSIAAISLLFAVHYRLYYASWHGAPFSIEWTFQFVFTTLAALYQFLVLGTRLFLPFGLIALFAVSLWHVRTFDRRRPTNVEESKPL